MLFRPLEDLTHTTHDLAEERAILQRLEAKNEDEIGVVIQYINKFIENSSNSDGGKVKPQLMQKA